MIDLRIFEEPEETDERHDRESVRYTADIFAQSVTNFRHAAHLTDFAGQDEASQIVQEVVAYLRSAGERFAVIYGVDPDKWREVA
ncbi:MAG: hypothetical protein AAF532_09675 [Planctomycetota bacterium]